MRARDAAELLMLAALWGGAFLFMRMGAGEFGPVALVAVRVSGAALLLVPLVALRGHVRAMLKHAGPIFVVGVTNTALPFLGFSYAALSITGGLSSIFNASSPLFAALIGRLLFAERLDRSRIAGIAIGFGGVLFTAWNGADVKTGGSPGLAVAACLAAACGYGWSPHYMRRRLEGVPPLAVAGGSQLAAAIVAIPPALLVWPSTPLPAPSWATAAALAILCTGVAYILYFRLIAHVGGANAIAVTFLIPAFAIAWGWLFLDERVTLPLVGGCAVILAGTALATGLVRLPIARGSKAPVAVRAAD
jgi:drug/metabolite transporter (DMT)-like permease